MKNCCTALDSKKRSLRAVPRTLPLSSAALFNLPYERVKKLLHSSAQHEAIGAHSATVAPTQLTSEQIHRYFYFLLH